MHGWLNPPVAETKPLAWLKPAAGGNVAYSSWLNPEVAVKRDCPGTETSTPKRKKDAAWLTPNVGTCRHDDSCTSQNVQHPAIPEIDITVGAALMVVGGDVEAVQKDDTHSKERVQKVQQMCKSPCRNGKGKNGSCTSCEDGLNSVDALAFLKLWNAMKGQQKTHLLNTLFDTAGGFQASRVRVKFLGNRICVARLCQILQTSPRTFYKHRSGRPDRRASNGKPITDAQISVNMFFYNLYHTAAEFLPEHEHESLKDVDSVIDAAEQGACTSSATCLPSDDLLPLIGQDPEKQASSSNGF